MVNLLYKRKRVFNSERYHKVTWQPTNFINYEYFEHLVIYLYLVLYFGVIWSIRNQTSAEVDFLKLPKCLPCQAGTLVTVDGALCCDDVDSQRQILVHITVLVQFAKLQNSINTIYFFEKASSLSFGFWSFKSVIVKHFPLSCSW